MSQLIVISQQNSPGLGADGTHLAQRATRDGIPFIASWKQALLLEGRVFQVTVGSLSAGADIAPITGGGGNLVVDQDQPEFIIGVPNGLTLIPLDIMISVNGDVDADTEVIDIILTADTTSQGPSSVTGTIESPTNMITNGPGPRGTAFSAITSDITDPTVSMILDSETLTEAAVTVVNALVYSLKLHYAPKIPVLLKGPASLYGYWGGTADATGVASIVYAEVPESRFTV